jgi:hypothetical protein
VAGRECRFCAVQHIAVFVALQHGADERLPARSGFQERLAVAAHGRARQEAQPR